MKAVTSREILDFYRQEDIDLNRVIKEALRQGKSKQRDSYEPTPILAAVAEAGRFLRYCPDRALASGKLACREVLGNDSASRALINIINTSVDRESLSHDVAHFIHGARRGAISVCALAEIGFLAAVQSLEHFIDGKKPVNGSQIIVHEGRPILLRKSMGVKSSLALRQVNLNGVVYPAGSIIYTQPGNKPKDEQLPRPPTDSVEVVSSDAVGSAFFARLSAFALKLAEREEGFPLHDSVEPHEAHAINSLTIRRIGTLATAAAEIICEREDIYHEHSI